MLCRRVTLVSLLGSWPDPHHNLCIQSSISSCQIRQFGDFWNISRILVSFCNSSLYGRTVGSWCTVKLCWLECILLSLLFNSKFPQCFWNGVSVVVVKVVTTTRLIGCLSPLLSDFVIWLMLVTSGTLARASCISAMAGWLTSNPRIRYCPWFFTC